MDKLKEYIKQLVREILNEENNLKITSISLGRNSGMARGAIGNYYNVKLSNGKTIKVSDDEFLDRYHELRNLNRKPDLNQLNKILLGKNWEDNLDEESTSGDVGFYSTPFAFKKQKNKVNESLDTIINKMLINEQTYNKFKNEVKFRTKNEQLHKAIREVKRKLQEINRIVEYTSRMKQELSEGEEGIRYWKATEKNVGQISEMLNQLSNKIKNLHQ